MKVTMETAMVGGITLSPNDVYGCDDREGAALINAKFAKLAPEDAEVTHWQPGLDPARVAEPEPEDDDVMLFGSNIFGAHFDIGGEQIQLGTIVVAAQVASGLSAKDWNALPEVARDALIETQAVARGWVKPAPVVEPTGTPPPPPATETPATVVTPPAETTEPAGKPKAAPKAKKPAAA